MNNAGFSTAVSGLAQWLEVAAGTAAVHVRDSKAVAGPVLTVSCEAWAGFVGLAVSESGV